MRRFCVAKWRDSKGAGATARAGVAQKFSRILCATEYLFPLRQEHLVSDVCRGIESYEALRTLPSSVPNVHSQLFLTK